jgi:CDP-glycerol glycerophosphotransferase (TagB/SpsB family)
VRKNIRNQIIEIIHTIWEGIIYSQNVEKDDGIIVLNDCNVALDSILKTLISELSEQRMEYYKEIIENIKKLLIKFKQSVLKKYIERDILIEIKENIECMLEELENEQEVKLEILFLPYKACMWDSLESIWITANNDEQCRCYVMPIPYFDRNNNGELGEMHYEGDLFPDYVPITHYTQYEMSKSKPDIIYIHNPYDEYNFITSVHPIYYSNRLKMYTDMLVYVPYFVGMDNVSEHFCSTSGVLNADKVIVQSDKIRETYLKYSPEDKIAALGSPKIDKALGNDKKDIVIPEEWERVIKGRKIVLYNTHLDNLMNHMDKVIDKLEYVFSCFKNRDNVVLLWRPHPLSEATTRSMRPQILERYLELERKFKNDGNGILDDTADLNRAIAISDAYLGDWSSLVPIYGVTGKPIMIQNIGIDSELLKEERRSLWFEDMVIEGDTMWFPENNFNGLFKMDMITKKIELLCEFSNDNINELRKYGSVSKYRDKMIFAPMGAKDIAIYNTSNKELTKCKLKEPKISKKISYNESLKFFATVNYKNWIFIIGCSYPAIIKVNMDTDEVEYYTDWVKKVEKYISNENDVIFRNDVYVRGNSIFIPGCNANIVMEFNMDSGNAKIHEVGDKECCYSSICFDGKDFWLSPRRSGDIVKWNEKTGEIKKYNNYPEGFMSGYNSFSKIIYNKSEIILFPAEANMTLKVDIETGKMMPISMLDEIYEQHRYSCNNWAFKYYLVDSSDENMYIFPSKNNKFISWNRETMEITEYPMILNKEYEIQNTLKYKELYDMQSEKNYKPCDVNYYEGCNISIPEYLNFLGNKENFKNVKQIMIYKELFNNSNGTCGQEIHYYIMKSVT